MRVRRRAVDLAAHAAILRAISDRRHLIESPSEALCQQRHLDFKTAGLGSHISKATTYPCS